MIEGDHSHLVATIDDPRQPDEIDDDQLCRWGMLGYRPHDSIRFADTDDDGDGAQIRYYYDQHGNIRYHARLARA